MGDTNELIPEEVDELNQRLIQDLRRLYPSGTQVSQPLARVQQRLFHSYDETLHGDLSPRPQSLSRGTLGTQQRKTRTVSAGGRVWPRHLGTLAAVACAALLVGSLIVVLQLARQNSTGGAGSSLHQPEAVTSLHMLDATNGWALTASAVLRTTDGGSHWRNVTPPHMSFSQGSIADFFTVSLAWIAVPQAGAAAVHNWRTTDGGQSWQQSMVQASSVKQMTFTDAQHGWILSGKEYAAGVAAEPVSVLRTADGGQTWQSISTALFADTTPPGHLPYGGQKSGIRFLNTTTGWVTGNVTLNNLAWLYITHDGGQSWFQQTLPMPSGVPAAQLSILAPTFFSATDGVLPVRFSDLITGKSVATVIYTTHDGGTTWQATIPVPIALEASSFLDGQQGWITDGSSLYGTSDGGQHWTKRIPGGSFTNVTQLDFVSSTLGWALNGQGLLKTIDGGQTWA
jgi:photosystem II stability/assembly factor-like uncharacterized protein